ncbi:MAG: hypothetical protein ACYTHM_05280, partial [Planctomycetota bacterium]
RVNEKLRFLYGFETDDLIRGKFEVEGQSFEIRQGAVKKHAMSIMDGSNKAQIIKDVHKNKGILLGWDAHDGALHYHLNAENFVLSMVSGRFEAVGAGRYASGISFADFLGNQTLRRRREGHDRVEGAFQLILSGIMASRFFHEVGGNLHMTVIDGRGKSHGERMRFIDEERMRLAVEAVQSARMDFVGKAAALEVVEGMIFNDLSVEKGERMLFKAAAKPKGLELFLRGYKAFELPDWPGGKAAVLSGGKKGVKK